MLNKKFITKLLGDEFRKDKIKQFSKVLSNKDLMISEYAYYVSDYQILNRSEQFKDDKKAFYGFSPIAPICYVSPDGSVQHKMFEMNSVNHFLKLQQGEKAVEVIMCILAQMYIENKDKIQSFNVKFIDAYLKAIERQYIEQKKQEKEQVKDEEKDVNNGN